MTSEAVQKERTQSAHLSIVVVQTITVVAMILETFLAGWELWMAPVLFIGCLFSWTAFVRQLYTEKWRVWLYAIVIWVTVVFHAVHPTSAYDFAPVFSGVMILFSLADEKRIVRISMELFLACFVWHAYLFLFTDKSVVPWNIVTVFRILLFLSSDAFACWVSYAVINQRMKDRKLEEEDIAEFLLMQKRSEDFLANVSHELRTPINAVLGIGSVMRQNAADEKEKQNAEEIFRAGRRLSSQIEDMLDYTELDTGTLRVGKEPYGLSSVLNDVVTRLDLRSRQYPFAITFDVDSALPARLVGDASLVKKILWQAISRALSDTKEGEVRIHVYPRERTYGINLCIEVTDTGLGLTPAQLEEARAAKYRVLNERTKSSMGLGLTFPILNGLAEAMGGFCNVESLYGEGTRVHVSIPQGVEENAGYVSFTPGQAEEEDTAQEQAASFDGLLVLVVDDEPMNLTVATSIFSEYGMVVQTAGGGEEAIRMARERTYDVIFMDHMMPGMDGVECMHHIRALSGDIALRTRMIALTANASSAAREMFFAEGFDGFLAKPVERAELVRTLRTALVNRGGQQDVPEP